MRVLRIFRALRRGFARRDGGAMEDGVGEGGESGEVGGFDGGFSKRHIAHCYRYFTNSSVRCTKPLNSVSLILAVIDVESIS
jgi:hypothetical protein